MTVYGRKFILWRRDHKHISQAELARILGISRRTVQNIEAGNFYPSERTLAKFNQLVERHNAARKTRTATPIWR